MHIFGIRHHGPGSARSLRAALEEVRPDCVLVEGPPDAVGVLPLLAHPQMRPPVALLIYVPDEPRRSAMYPFAVFSPEWQAIHYALTHNIPVRFMDLPQAHQLALQKREEEAAQQQDPQPPTPNSQPPTPDPLGALAEAAGYSDGEIWWEHLVEQRQDHHGLFQAILEAMTEMRSTGERPEDNETLLREAHMRQTIRAAQAEGFTNIAVVCGAWHGPALAEMPPAKADAELLKGLPKLKVEATWVPWTYGRLTSWSGYGAGIDSPGWYHHLWESGQKQLTATRMAIAWLTKVAHFLREEDLDISPAHVIEAARLSETLAALRERPLPGLPELNEAVQAIYCFGSDAPMRLIGEKLIVNERLGAVPAETPMVPLQQDLQREQKRLRLPPEAAQKPLDLDLRNDTDLGRSHLLHRLGLLGIHWGVQEQVTGKLGTFHELWRLQWQPEFAVAIIEASRWGNTVHDAAAGFARAAADNAKNLETLTTLLDRVLYAELPDAAGHVMARLQAMAAVASDVPSLMAALPPLANILRYSDVRKTDAEMVADVVDGLVARVCIGLPGACASLDDEAAGAMFTHLVNVDGAVGLLRNDEYTALWREALGKLLDQQGLHGLLAGRSCRLLHDDGLIPPDEVARRLGLALSQAVEPLHAGNWVDGLLRGSGLILLHDAELLGVLDDWVSALDEDRFTDQLPLLRRTFATFPSGERRQIGEKIKRDAQPPQEQPKPQQEFNAEQADEALSALNDLF
ncbi:MAG: DUF5682 family protein [Armatimonadota bacterium]